MSTTFPYSITCQPAPPDTIEGPVTVSQITSAQLTVDRTVAGGLNSLQSTDSVGVNVEGSPNTTGPWTLIVGTVWPGGIIMAPQTKGGPPVEVTSEEMDASVDPSQYGHVRVRITPSAKVTLAGNIVTTP